MDINDKLELVKAVLDKFPSITIFDLCKNSYEKVVKSKIEIEGLKVICNAINKTIQSLLLGLV